MKKTYVYPIIEWEIFETCDLMKIEGSGGSALPDVMGGAPERKEKAF